MFPISQEQLLTVKSVVGTFRSFKVHIQTYMVKYLSSSTYLLHTHSAPATLLPSPPFPSHQAHIHFQAFALSNLYPNVLFPLKLRSCPLTSFRSLPKCHFPARLSINILSNIGPLVQHSLPLSANFIS